MTRKVEITLILLIVLMALGVRAYFFAATHNMFSAENEGYSKIQLMMQWEQSPLPYPDTNFGPLHTILLWIPAKLTGSLVTANRLMTLFFGMLLFLPVYRLVRRRFGPTEALGSILLLAWLYPLSVASVVTISEVPFVCLVLLGLDLLDELTLYPNHKWDRLVLAALAINLAAAVRFEVWALLPLFVAYMFIRRGWKEGTVFGALLMIFPLVHMYYCQKITGHPLSFVYASAQITAVNTALKPLAQRVVSLPLSLGRTIGWLGMLLALAGMIWAVVKKKLILPVLSVLILIVVMEKKSMDATLELEMLRYTSLLNGLLVLFVALPVAAAAHWRKLKSREILVVVLLVSAIAAGFSQASALWETSLLRPTKEVFDLLEKLKPELRPGERIFMGSEYHPVIVVESGLGWDNFRLPTYVDGVNPDRIQIAKAFTEWKPTVVLVDKIDQLFPALTDFSGKTEVEMYGRIYRYRWETKRWQLWRFVGQTP